MNAIESIFVNVLWIAAGIAIIAGLWWLNQSDGRSWQEQSTQFFDTLISRYLPWMKRAKKKDETSQKRD